MFPSPSFSPGSNGACSSAAVPKGSPALALQTPGKGWHHFPSLSLSQLSHPWNTPSAQFNAQFSTQILPFFHLSCSAPRDSCHVILLRVEGRFYWQPSIRSSQPPSRRWPYLKAVSNACGLLLCGLPEFTGVAFIFPAPVQKRPKLLASSWQIFGQTGSSRVCSSR